MKNFNACLIDCSPQKMSLVKRFAAPRSVSNWVKLLNQPVLKIVAVLPCPTNCATRAKHQILTSPNNESNDVELEDQHLSQVFQTDDHVSDSDDTTCMCKGHWNLKPKAPHLCGQQTWIRVGPNAEHHQQADAC